MIDPAESTSAALRPIWTLATAAALGGVLAATAPPLGGRVTAGILVTAGVVLLAAALATHPSRRALVLLALAGASLALGRGGQVVASKAEVDRLPDAAAIRIEAVVADGWQDSRWGSRAAIRLVSATHDGRRLTMPRSARLEIRGGGIASELPPPGTPIAALVAVRWTDRGLLLVASSPRIVSAAGPPRGVPAWRESLVDALRIAAGTDVARIRSAELAATLTLGRRDLLPRPRRDAWRRSGLAHVLAVSGLHVGLVGASVWLIAGAVGTRPGPARAATAISIVGYALLAGASPSALRAAAMGVVILGARSLGRGVLGMAAVLVAATAVLMIDPTLVMDAGFQLTVVITAALVRWVPPVVEMAPLPRFLAAAVAVPVIAQLAAAPIVAAHFRVVTPGAAITNLAVPLLVTPLLAAALLAAAVAPVLPPAAGLLLDLMGWIERVLWLCGAPSRSSGLLAPAMPTALAIVAVAAGWLALRSRPRRAAVGAGIWVLVTVTAVTGWPWRPPPHGTAVEVLPVADGLSAIAFSDGDAVLIDGGRSPTSAARLLRDRGVTHLDVVIASHTDDDHMGGLPTVIRAFSPHELLMPAWMMSDPATAPVLRAARHRGTRIRPVAQGVSVQSGGLRLDVLWPPAVAPPQRENERSVVVRARFGGSGVALLTADIGRDTERRVAHGADLSCDVLLVPHHGSRNSMSDDLLDDARPAVALIPAGPYNLHGHPSGEVLARLEERGIPFRAPALHGRCGARRTESGHWDPYPD